MSRLSLDSQTAFGMPPARLAEIAADLGCGYFSTGLTPLPWKLNSFPAWSLRDDPIVRGELKSVMRDLGVQISLAEGFTIRPGSNARNKAADFDLFAELGAKRAGTVSMDPNVQRSLDELAILTELAAERDMQLLFEFAPPHTFNNLAKALAAVQHVGLPNIALLIDSLHFYRSGGTVADIAAIDAKLIGYAQLSDGRLAAPSGDYYREASFQRERPGEGELPLIALLAALPPTILIGLEVPMEVEIEEAQGVSRDHIMSIVNAGQNCLAASADWRLAHTD